MNGEQMVQLAWPSGERVVSVRPVGGTMSAGGLGTARASDRWQWAPVRVEMRSQGAAVAAEERSEPRRIATSASAVRIPEGVLRTMRKAAWSAGRTESEIWAEAAREWLMRRAREDEPQPPTPAAAALPVPRVAHAWHAIDALLAELRMSSRETSPLSAPAA
ncbi:MAG: hypothetical protein ACHQ4H_17965 [Ktedonobacterales bacterium]